jgi:hypothetical protein
LDTEIEGADRSSSVGLQQLILSNDRPKAARWPWPSKTSAYRSLVYIVREAPNYTRGKSSIMCSFGYFPMYIVSWWDS